MFVLIREHCSDAMIMIAIPLVCCKVQTQSYKSFILFFEIDRMAMTNLYLLQHKSPRSTRPMLQLYEAT